MCLCVCVTQKSLQNSALLGFPHAAQRNLPVQLWHHGLLYKQGDPLPLQEYPLYQGPGANNMLTGEPHVDQCHFLFSELEPT